MTERLRDLLDHEAEGVDVPTPPAVDVVRRARGLRRRRRVAAGGAALAVVVIAGAAALALTSDGGPEAPDPADPTNSAPAYAIGNTIYYGDEVVAVDDKAVKSLYYTSAGILVRHGNNSYSDGGGPQRFSLVTDDGAVQPVGVETEETVHNTDPGQPYVVYGERVAGVVNLVVHDVESDDEAARVPLPDATGSWFPVALAGNTAYLQSGDDVYAVEWSTGEIAHSDVIPHVLDVAGGHALVHKRNGGASVIATVSGEEVASTSGDAMLSPDGRHLQSTTVEALSEQVEDPSDVRGTTTVLDVDTGEEATLDHSQPWGWAWTASGDLFTIDEESAELVTCSATTGDCESTPVDLPQTGDGALDIIYGGLIRES